jgi:hypothetical protein
MATSLEVLTTGRESRIGTLLLKNTVQGARRAGFIVSPTRSYRGDSDLLTIFGAGAEERMAARFTHLSKGGHVVSWDHGYYSRHGRPKDPTKAYLRASWDNLHPQSSLSATPPDPSRWLVHNIVLREDSSADGHIIVVALGPKSRKSLSIHDWEHRKLAEIAERFPGRKIIYRPKPGKDRPDRVKWLTDQETPIEKLLVGASLVVCRHSNVAVDAIIAGVPFECEDGAAFWLQNQTRTPTVEQRLDFLYRLSWWQWRCDEMEAAWKFLATICV